jgi:hypothetical protein
MARKTYTSQEEVEIAIASGEIKKRPPGWAKPTYKENQAIVAKVINDLHGAGTWDEQKHPRAPAGSERGGEFTKK